MTESIGAILPRVMGTARGEPEPTPPIRVPRPPETVRERLIPPRFRDVNFNTFEVRTPSQGVAARAILEWGHAIADGPMLALIGKQGTGKSHLFYSAVDWLVRFWSGCDEKTRGAAPFVAPWYRLADELRYGGRGMDPAAVRAELWSRRVVMLDEVRPTSGTDFDESELAKFACHAYDNRISVLITTNTNPLDRVMGEAAASRFVQVIVDGPDARQS